MLCQRRYQRRRLAACEGLRATRASPQSSCEQVASRVPTPTGHPWAEGRAPASPCPQRPTIARQLAERQPCSSIGAPSSFRASPDLGHLCPRHERCFRLQRCWPPPGQARAPPLLRRLRRTESRRCRWWDLRCGGRDSQRAPRAPILLENSDIWIGGGAFGVKAEGSGSAMG